MADAYYCPPICDTCLSGAGKGALSRGGGGQERDGIERRQHRRCGGRERGALFHVGQKAKQDDTDCELSKKERDARKQSMRDFKRAPA